MLKNFKIRKLGMNKGSVGLKICFALFLCFVLQACDKALFDAGPETEFAIDIKEPFTMLDFKNIFDVTLVQDTVNKVIVSCGANLQTKVDVKVVDNVLCFDNSVKDIWSREYKHIKLEVHLVKSPSIKIHAPILLRNRGVISGNTFWLCDYDKFSDVNLTLNVKTCSIYMTSDNFGVFTVKGKAEKSDLWGWGSAVVHADSLLTQTCHVKHRGFGQVYVNVTNKLAVSLEFTGNVYCTSKPTSVTIEKQLSTGQLIFNP